MSSFAVKLDVPPLNFSTNGWRPIPICMFVMSPEHLCRANVSSQSILMAGVMQDLLGTIAWKNPRRGILYMPKFNGKLHSPSDLIDVFRLTN